MSVSWRSVGWMSGVLVVAILAALGISLAVWHTQQARQKQKLGPYTLFPLLIGPGSIDGPVDSRRHCVILPAGFRLAPGSISKEAMDGREGAGWVLISERMKPGDDIYAYTTAPPWNNVPFGGSGGFVVLRGRCMVGRMVTWVS